MPVPEILSVIRNNAVAVTLTTRVQSLNATGHGEDVDSSSSIQAVIQPPGPEDLQSLPEGQSVAKSRIIWSETELPLRALVTDPEGTTVTITGTELWREGLFHKAVGLLQQDSS